MCRVQIIHLSYWKNGGAGTGKSCKPLSEATQKEKKIKILLGKHQKLRINRVDNRNNRGKN